MSYHVRWPHKSRSSQGHTWKKNNLAGFSESVIPKIWIYDSFYVFKGEESIFDLITELPCLGDFGNPGQLPVQEVLESTDDCVL